MDYKYEVQIFKSVDIKFYDSMKNFPHLNKKLWLFRPNSTFFYQILKTTSNIINLTVPIIAEKDTRSSSFHYEWHLQYKLVSIYNGT